jgi:hypothetical protein
MNLGRQFNLDAGRIGLDAVGGTVVEGYSDGVDVVSVEALNLRFGLSAFVR